MNRFDLAIIAKPDSLFDPKDQVIIDQFIMNGGRVMWLVDPIAIDLDSLARNSFTMGVTNELGIYDQLFQYGCASTATWSSICNARRLSWERGLWAISKTCSSSTGTMRLSLCRSVRATPSRPIWTR